ncbi:MAG: GatB/YqeY domain-containing protein [Alphaproteobacteria bacterium]|nr:GatB/YqeY domain-containing protein [Alphaproteobacteria bacterium]
MTNSLREKITESLKAAMIAKDEASVSILRMINAAIKQKDIDVARPRGDQQISPEEVLSLMQGMIKQRRESIELYKQGGRQELVDKENAEIAAIEKFLPKQMSEDEVRGVVKGLIASTGAAGIKDMGKIMGVLKTQYAGQLDMGKASGIIKEMLSAAA